MKTGKRPHVVAEFAFAGLFGLGAVAPVLGCGFHPAMEVELDTMYPGSLAVAVALRKGAQNGIIDAVATAPGNSEARYDIAVHRLQAFAQTLAASPAAGQLPANFSLGYVESRLWSRFSHEGGRVSVQVHTDGPAKDEAVVLTGEPVVNAILSGKLPVKRAIADGLLVIEGDARKTTAIRQALETVPATGRVSSR